MKIKINSQEKDIQNGLTILELLKSEKVKMPEMVSVELNEMILNRVDFEKTQVNNNDEVNFLYFMGGGV